LGVHGVASRAIMTGHRLFFPLRDTPTLIWIKEKGGIFCSKEPRRIFQSVDTGPVAENLTLPKAILPPAAKPLKAGAPRWYNWLHRRERHENPMPQAQFLIEAFDRERWCPVLQAMFCCRRSGTRPINVLRCSKSPIALLSGASTCWSRLHEILGIATRRSVAPAGRADCRIQPLPPGVGTINKPGSEPPVVIHAALRVDLHPYMA
jgi:hypothetical protein